MWEPITGLLDSLTTERPNFPPTLIYNEGWLLRLVLAAMQDTMIGQPFGFHSGAAWFSEAQLRSAFLARPGSPSNHLAESHTRADGVVGHFRFNAKTRTGLELINDSTQFVVCEAKLFNLLSAGVKNAAGYDQAARNIGCMAETVAQKFRGGAWQGVRCDFYVLAPREQIERAVFIAEMLPDSIDNKISDRIEAYRLIDASRYSELMLWRNELKSCGCSRPLVFSVSDRGSPPTSFSPYALGPAMKR